MINSSIFRAYDIRGIYGKELTEQVAERIGKAYGSMMENTSKTVVLGRDVRLSSKPLGNAITQGITSCGINVEDIGMVTTPLLYFSSVFYQKDGGIMITASHNPPEWNGIKILGDKGFISKGMGMEALREKTLKGNFRTAEKGQVNKNRNAIGDYLDYVSNRIKISKSLKIVADPGNGSCSLLIPKVYEKSGLVTVSMYDQPDGTFASHPPHPTDDTLDGICRRILDEKADFGVGFDADGDRAIFVDDKGRVVPSNLIIVMLANHYLQDYPKAAIVFEVSCSMVVKDTIEEKGGKPIISEVGHTYIFKKMVNHKAVFGGETSGHFYFTDVFGFDDGIFASLKIAEILSKENKCFSEIIDSLPLYPRIPVKSYDCPDEKKFRIVKEMAKEFDEEGYEIVKIDGVKVVTDYGWFLIRPSNTQSLVRLTVEAKNNKMLKTLTNLADNRIIEKIGA